MVRTLPWILASIGARTVAAAFNCTGIAAVSPKCASKETAYIRDYYYVGGEYVYDTSLSANLFADQLYVEKLTPVRGVSQPYPLVFISAGVPSGNVWLNTPDNRKGWASYFIEQGYQVYLLDITANGRSSQNWIAEYPMRLSSDDKITQNDYTAPELIDPYPQSLGHTQWPGNGTRGDPFFDFFMASMLPLTSNTTAQELSMRYSGCALLRLIGQSYLISHSAGATYSTLMSDECPDLIKASINIEPGNTPFQNLVGNSTVLAVGRTSTRTYGLTNTPITYDPPITNVTSQLLTEWVGDDLPALRSCVMQAPGSVHKLPNIAKVPYVAFTASASPHITYDQCTINYLVQAGVTPEWIKLSDLGILGNGHFMYLEKNNLAIAAVVNKWIKKHNNNEGEWWS